MCGPFPFLVPWERVSRSEEKREGDRGGAAGLGSSQECLSSYPDSGCFPVGSC